MRFILAIIVGALATLGLTEAALTEQQTQQLFSRYVSVFGKSYASKEVAAKYAVWKDNLSTIIAHNAQPNVSFTMAMNKFGDLTSEEFAARMSFRTISRVATAMGFNPNATKVMEPNSTVAGNLNCNSTVAGNLSLASIDKAVVAAMGFNLSAPLNMTVFNNITATLKGLNATVHVNASRFANANMTALPNGTLANVAVSLNSNGTLSNGTLALLANGSLALYANKTVSLLANNTLSNSTLASMSNGTLANGTLTMLINGTLAVLANGTLTHLANATLGNATLDSVFNGTLANGKVDWRQAGVVNPVKNQLGCTSGYAFAALASVEAVNARKNGTLVSFSEQDVVDCSPVNWGCNGGLMTASFDYIAKSGVSNSVDYPYSGKFMQKCNAAAVRSKPIAGFAEIPENDEAALLAAAEKHVVSVAVNSKVLQFYSKGVIDTKCDGLVNHGVALVAFDKSEKTATIRNSWGADWGENGYARVRLNMNAICMAQMASFAVVN